MQKKPLPWCSFVGYKLLSSYWWKEVLSYVIGIQVQSALVSWTLRSRRVMWNTPGWWRDITTIYHRARYGWAPRDHWDMYTHLEKVLSEMLLHFADTTHSYAERYSSGEAWSAQLREWAIDIIAVKQFEESDEYLRLLDTDPQAFRQALERARGRRNAALQGIIESWDDLWD